MPGAGIPPAWLLMFAKNCLMQTFLFYYQFPGGNKTISVKTFIKYIFIYECVYTGILQKLFSSSYPKARFE